MSQTSLDEWMSSHPPAQRGPLAPHRPAMRQLADAGYTHQEIRAWLASLGVQVSRQAVTKALASAAATASRRPPPGQAPAHRKPGEATGPQPCTPSKNRAVAPAPGPDATLKNRALAVGEKYLSNTLNPLVAQMLTSQTKRKT